MAIEQQSGAVNPGAQAPILSVWRGVALISGLFTLAVCGAMLVSHYRARAQDPWQSPRLLALKETLLTTPKDEALKENIRALDLQLRRRYFHSLSLNQSGAWLVLASAGVFLFAVGRMAKARQALPMPQPNPHAAEERLWVATRSRWAVAGLALVTALGLGSVALTTRTALPPDMTELNKFLMRGRYGASTVVDFASLEEMERNWPRFRGASGSGVTVATNVPLTWDAKSGKAILWKTEVTTPGFNSPIVWGEQIFLAGADAEKRVVLCYGTGTGQLLWERPVAKIAASPAQAPEVPEQTGYAASTMATDGRRVYAIFANGDLVALTLDGQPVWAKNLGVPKNPHGHASSLATWEDRLFVQLDQGEAEQNRSRLFAFDGRTGRVLWERTRSVAASWSTPIVIQAAGKSQVITLAVPWAIAYGTTEGTELWRVEGLNNEVTPSPVFAGGMVLAVSPNEKLLAIRPEGQGDVTKTHIAWSADDNAPDISSPVSDGDLVFALSTPGLLTCFDVKDGKKQWEQDLEMECDASPSIVGRRLYVISLKGVVLVAEVGRAFKELARGEMDENVYASPAFVGGRAYVRGAKHLFGIGDGNKLAKTD